MASDLFESFGVTLVTILLPVVLMMGINDIGWPGGPFAPDEAPMTADRLTAAALVTDIDTQLLKETAGEDTAAIEALSAAPRSVSAKKDSTEPGR